VAQTARTSVGETLVGADDLTATPCSLVVLQAEPVDTDAQPLGALRAGLLGFARLLLDGGVPNVLVVPPLPDDSARAVVDMVARTVADRRRPASAVTHLRLLDAVKRIVREAEPVPEHTTEAAGERASLDTILYLTTRF
jgi:hypothetical protein